jgi:hypothetical protein
MIKLLIAVISTVIIGDGCRNTKGKADSRDVVIKKAIKEIENYDSIQLYGLIDTSYCFDIYGKDGFIHKIDYVYNRFKICGSSIVDTLIKIREKQLHVREYSLAFCRGSRHEVIYDSFDLLFSFSNFDNKILFLDIAIYRREIRPTIPLKGKE